MSKYHAIRTDVDGISFSSRKEANRYCELKLLQQVGVIYNLELQPKFPLVVNGKKIGVYIADFSYVENGNLITEDVKGILTPVYKLKKNLVQALYNVTILET